MGNLMPGKSSYSGWFDESTPLMKRPLPFRRPPIANATKALDTSQELQSLPAVKSLVEIVSSMLPDLLGQYGNTSASVADVDLEVNYTHTDSSMRAGRRNFASVSIGGKFVISAEGEYEFLAKPSNGTQVEGVYG